MRLVVPSERIEVYPHGDDWYWRLGTERSNRFTSRREAYENALERREFEAIVLLRRDGSLHGEMHEATKRVDG